MHILNCLPALGIRMERGAFADRPEGEGREGEEGAPALVLGVPRIEGGELLDVGLETGRPRAGHFLWGRPRLVRR